MSVEREGNFSYIPEIDIADEFSQAKRQELRKFFSGLKRELLGVLEELKKEREGSVPEKVVIIKEEEEGGKEERGEFSKNGSSLSFYYRTREEGGMFLERKVEGILFSRESSNLSVSSFQETFISPFQSDERNFAGQASYSIDYGNPFSSSPMITGSFSFFLFKPREGEREIRFRLNLAGNGSLEMKITDSSLSFPSDILLSPEGILSIGWGREGDKENNEEKKESLFQGRLVLDLFPLRNLSSGHTHTLFNKSPSFYHSVFGEVQGEETIPFDYYVLANH